MTGREKHGGNLKDSPPTLSHGDVETDSDRREGEPNTYTQKMTVSDKQREGRAHTQSQVDKERAHAKSERLGGTRRHTLAERRHWQLEQPEGKGPAPHMQTRFTSDAGIKINVDDSAADTCMRQHHCQPEWH